MVRMGIGGILVTSTAELKRTGETRYSIARRLKEGTLHRIMRGLYSDQHLTPMQLCETFSLLKPHLAFTGVTAIQLFLGQPVTLPLHAVVPRGKSDKGGKSLRITRRRCIPTTRIHGITVLCAAAVVRDLSLLSPRNLVNTLKPIRRRLRDSTQDVLTRVLEQHYARRTGPAALEKDTARLGTACRTGLTALLGRASIGADSETERKVFRKLKIKGWKIKQNVKVGSHFWDGLVQGKKKVVVDIDGTAFHNSHAAFVKDRWKNNDAISQGYYALRYTSTCVDHRVEEVVKDIIEIASGQRSPFSDYPVWRWHRGVAECRHDSAAEQV